MDSVGIVGFPVIRARDCKPFAAKLRWATEAEQSRDHEQASASS